MWMAKKLARGAGDGSGARSGYVTANQGMLVVQGEIESRGLRIAAPWGIHSLPPQGVPALVFPSLGICAGILAQDPETGISPGEVLIRSSGGAEILLKNSGEVVINGQVFAAKEGE